MKIQQILASVLIMVMGVTLSHAQEVDADAELAKKLANPVASLISVPISYDYDENFGADGQGAKSVLTVKPVIPFSIGEEWNLITRTIIPFIDQQDLPVAGLDESGLGDISQSFFFSPKAPIGGWILAAGPVLLYPSASDEVLGGEKWGVGPTVLALRQMGPWSVGLLASHTESFEGEEERADISLTYAQPFVSYITKTKTTFGLNTETTYDWESEQTTVPVNLTVSQLLKIGNMPVQFTLGGRYWADSPDNGPEDFGLRAQLTLLFPK
ncbi:MAG: transporter [Planctomycetota bacterium]|nr:transporter [Planctomycetota bacterium]